MDFGRIWAEVNLDALNWNLDRVRRFVDGRPLLMAVKADGYGHGLVEVARELQDRVTAFGVAGVDEGIKLRRAGVREPVIIVLSPAPYEEIPDLFAHRLTPTVTEPEFADRLSRAAQERRLEIGVHIEVDTGMGRTGVGLDEAGNFIRAVAALPGLKVEGVFTHFPSADTDILFTETQLAAYFRLLAELEQEGFDRILRHSANSAGLLNVRESHLDMVRPGLIVYGILPESYRAGRRRIDLDLRPVMSLRSRIVNLRRIPAGRSISYDRNYFTTRESTIAVITAGYGDGYPWALTNHGHALVHCHRAPIVGNVCMDLTMLDVTDVPGVRIGDPVTLLGAEGEEIISANDLATWAGTIPYDIICRVSPRVPRIYIKDGRVSHVRSLLNNHEGR
ncbi:MAG: alanine racemase [bacterium]